MKYTLLFLIFIGSLVRANTQTFNFLDIPVFEDGHKLQNAWAGGLNAPQWSSFDLNNDGLKDLYAFDRLGNVHLAFINQDGTPGAVNYKYARHWLANFPEVYNYVMMRDYNRDGIEDMFASSFTPTFGVSGIKVYKGKKSNGQLDFDQLTFPDYSFDVIPFVQDGEVIDKIEVFNNSDYPAIDDIDGDGDLDILAMNISGSKVNYFKNVALEKGFTDDTLLFEFADDCWGRFGLTPFSQKLTLSGNATDCAFFRSPDHEEEDRIHGGTTFCAFDADNDGDKEILYGDLIYPTIIFGTNTGNPNQAYISEQDTMFPSFDVPVDIADFVASYHLDVNNDGAKDLVFSPNLPLGTLDLETAWFYENGSSNGPDFSLVKKTLLSDEMLDFGTGANPAFADVNGDGLLDLVVGNRMEWVNSFGDANYYLVLMLNIGTATEPVFDVVDRDWLGLKGDPTGIRSFSPNFGDIDNDGDIDLLIGDFDGFVHLFENIAGPGEPMDFAPINYNWKNINIGRYATPFVYDLNKDGLSDLIIGERNGTVNYFPNIGSMGNPDFNPVEEEAPNNNQLGNINTQLGGSVGFSQPVVVQAADADYIISGTDKGWLMYYKVNPDSLDHGSFELVDGQLGGLREGVVTKIALANITGNNYLEAVVGNDRGGLTMFQSPISADGVVGTAERPKVEAPRLTLNPNPVNDFIKIGMSNGALPAGSEYEIYNSMGQVAAKGNCGNGLLDTSRLALGMYFIRVNPGSGPVSGRFVKR